MGKLKYSICYGLRVLGFRVFFLKKGMDDK
jgi:hypothetical protein